MTNSALPTIRIFISSPGDVAEERDRAKQVVENLRRRYARRFSLKPVLWEELPLQMDRSFQQGIDLVLSQEQGIDIAIFILWSRLGSPVGPRIVKDDGTEYLSGTERELHLMLQARQQSTDKRPSILVYTRSDETSFEERLRGKPTSEKEDLIAQKKLVETFIKETFRDRERGYNIGAYHAFDRPTTFSQRLRVHLIELLDELAGDMSGTVWDIDKRGPPFLGLNAFQPQHAEIFFGREEETLEARFALREQAKQGCAFLLLTGASGSGKSSLARAGLLPEIMQNELDDQVARWRSLIVSPAELTHDPILEFVRRLARPDVLPEIRTGSNSLETLARDLREHPDVTFRHAIQPVFERLAMAVNGGIRLLLVIDQLEEMFAAHVMTSADRAAFLTVIETFARSGLVWCLATSRSDFYHQIQNEPVLVRLMQGRGPFPVTPPGSHALQRLIEEPARLAGLRYEDHEGVSLAGRILRDAAAHAELLPLLEFLLRELFESRTAEGLLTAAAYDRLGGVTGAVGKQAEVAFQGLPAEAQSALPDILPLLVTVTLDGEQSFVRRRAPLSELQATPSSRQLTEKLIASRFFTTDQHGETPIATFAHEALLEQWSRIADWINANRELLRLRTRVEQSQQRWEQHEQDASLLLPGGLPLEEARQLQQHGGHLLKETTRGYIDSSITFHTRAAARASKGRRTIITVLSVLTLLATLGGLFAWNQRDVALQATKDAQDQSTHAHNEANRADEEAKRAEQRGKENAILAEKETAARITAEANARLARSNLYVAHMNLIQSAWEEGSIPRVRYLLAQWQPVEDDSTSNTSTDISPTSEHTSQEDDIRNFEWYYWNNRTSLGRLRYWHADEPVECVAYNHAGTLLASGSGNTITLRDVNSGATLATLNGHTDKISSICFSPDGENLISGSYDSTLKIWSVSSGDAIKTLKGHKAAVLDVKYGKDGNTVASGSADQTAILWSIAANRQIHTLAASDNYGVHRVAFSPSHELLATLAWNEPVTIWDANSGEKLFILVDAEDAAIIDHRRVAAATFDRAVGVFDCSTGDKLQTLVRFPEAIKCLAYSEKQGRLFAASRGMVKAWDIANGDEVLSVREASPVNAIAMNSNGSMLATACDNGDIAIWDAVTGQDAKAFAELSNVVTNIVLSGDGELLLSCDSRGSVIVWKVNTGEQISALSVDVSEESLFETQPISMSSDGRRVVGIAGKRVNVWELPGARKVFDLNQAAGVVSSVALNSDGSILAVGNEGNGTQVWDLDKRRKVISYDDVSGDMSFTVNGLRIITEANKAKYVFDVNSGNGVLECRGVITRESDASELALSTNGDRVAWTENDGTARVWSVLAAGELSREHNLDSEVPAVTGGIGIGCDVVEGACVVTSLMVGGAAATDGRIQVGDTLVAIATPDDDWIPLGGKEVPEIVSLLRGRAGQQIRLKVLPKDQPEREVERVLIRKGLPPIANPHAVTVIKGLTGEIGSIALSGDGLRLASSSEDGTVKIWDSVSGQELLTIKVGEVVCNLRFSTDGRLLVGSSANKIFVWDASRKGEALPRNSRLAPAGGGFF